MVVPTVMIWERQDAKRSPLLPAGGIEYAILHKAKERTLYSTQCNRSEHSRVTSILVPTRAPEECTEE